MRVNLFDIDSTGKARITKHVKEIWYLSNIVEKYGEESALKLFQVFDKVYDLNPQNNAFANLPEKNKYETILRSTYPELELLIDLDDELIEQALDLVEELYSTAKYRAHKAIKILYDKIVDEITYSGVSLNKEDGNMTEINKALSAFDDLNKKSASSYAELEEEMNIAHVRGGGKRNRKQQEDLE